MAGTKNDAGTEAGEAPAPTTVTLQVKQPKAPKAPKPEPTGMHRELEMFRSAALEDEDGVLVRRIGPQDYYGEPVQLAVCGRLPPGTRGIEDAIKARWGGGTYQVTARARDGKPFPVEVPLAGRPLPIDLQQQKDQKDAAEREAQQRTGGYGSASGEWMWSAAQGAWLWVGSGPPPGPAPIGPPAPAGYAGGGYGGGYGGYQGYNPYVQGDPKIEQQLEQAREKIAKLEKDSEIAKVEAKLAALEAKLAAQAEGGGGKSAMSELMAAHTAQAQLALDREKMAQDAKRATDAQHAADERAAADRRAADERAAADRRSQDSRDMMNTLVTTLTTVMGAAANRSPFDDISKFVGAAASLKELSGDNSQAAEIERLMGAGQKMFLGTIQGMRAQPGAVNPPPQLPDGQQQQAQETAADDEDAVMAEMLEFLLNMFKRKSSPRDTAAMLIGWCRGKKIDAAKTIGTLKVVNIDQVLTLLQVEEARTADAVQKKFLGECRAELATPAGREWFAGLVKVL